MCLLLSFSILTLRQGFSLNQLGVHGLCTPAGHSSHLCLPSTGLPGACLHLYFHVGTEDLNAGPLASMMNI